MYKRETTVMPCPPPELQQKAAPRPVVGQCQSPVELEIGGNSPKYGLSFLYNHWAKLFINKTFQILFSTIQQFGRPKNCLSLLQKLLHTSEGTGLGVMHPLML